MPLWNRAIAWLERADPGVHRRIKGLRLVTAYGIAAALGSLHEITYQLSHNASLGTLAAAFALWTSASEGKTTRAESSRDLRALTAAAAFGAATLVCLAPLLHMLGRARWA